MAEELNTWWNQIKEAAGDEQKKLFIQYCLKLVQLKEEGVVSEEEAAYEMVGAIQFDALTDTPECEAIFDSATIVELPRITSYVQPIGKWDEKTADRIKQEEWQELVATIESAKTLLKID